MKKKLVLGIVFMIFGLIGKEAYAQSDLDTVTNDGQIQEFIIQENVENEQQEFFSYEGDGQIAEIAVPEFSENLNYITDYESMEEVISEIILGADDRKIVTNTTSDPYRKVAFLIIHFPNGKSYVGTGNLISKNMVLTAGHCLYSKNNGGWAKSIEVYPGRNGNISNGVAYSKQLFSVSGWVDRASSEYDIGAIKLDRDIGNSVGWFGLTTEMKGPITLTGYHGDLSKKMATEQGNIANYTTNNVYYGLDSTGGASGSGVYNSKQQILAVHAYGSQSNNFGTRMNVNNLQLVQSWINDDSLYKNVSVGSKFKIKPSATLFCGGQVTIPNQFKGDKLFEVEEVAWASTWVNAGSNRRAYKIKHMNMWVFENDTTTDLSNGKATYNGSIYVSYGVGDVVKFENGATNYMNGAAITPSVKTAEYKIVETKRITLQSRSLRAYRVFGLGNNWILEQDLSRSQIGTNYNGSIFSYREIGTTIQIRPQASTFYTGGAITNEMKQKTYTIKAAKWLGSIELYSWRAYELKELPGKWIYEHDLIQ